MHHLTLAQKSLLIGDEVADLLLAYAALVAERGGGDHVTVRAIGIDGEEVSAQVLLNSGTTLVAESTTSHFPEPDNEELIVYIRARLDFFGLLPGEGPPTDIGRIADPPPGQAG